MIFHVQVTMINHRQVEIESETGLVAEIAKQAKEKAGSEFGDADEIEIGEIESATLLYLDCSECDGTGEDLEDSSRDCFECHGSGQVVNRNR